MRNFLCALTLSLFFLSCGGDQPINLSVIRTTAVKKIGGQAPYSGSNKKFVVTKLQIDNNTSDPLLVALTMFWLVTNDNLATMSSGQTVVLSDGCDASMMMEPGASVTCEVAFEVDMDLLPIRARLQTADGRTASADIEFGECTWSGNDCIDLKNDPSNCGEPGLKVTDDQTCVDGKLICDDSSLTGCPGRCVDLKTSLTDCGQCGKPVSNGQKCLDGLPGCDDPSLTPCPHGCVNLKTSKTDCGECGHYLPASQNCINGLPVCDDPSLTPCPSACANLKTSSANCGKCGNSLPADQKCVNGVPTCATAGKTICDDGCFDLKTNNSHCGSCNTSCGAKQECVDGKVCANQVYMSNQTRSGEWACDQAGYPKCLKVVGQWKQGYGDSDRCDCVEEIPCTDAPDTHKWICGCEMFYAGIALCK